MFDSPMQTKRSKKETNGNERKRVKKLKPGFIWIFSKIYKTEGKEMFTSVIRRAFLSNFEIFSFSEWFSRTASLRDVSSWSFSSSSRIISATSSFSSLTLARCFSWELYGAQGRRILESTIKGWESNNWVRETSNDCFKFWISASLLSLVASRVF